MNKFQDTFSIEGYWWFPNNPDRTVPGILTHSPKNITLHLMGALTDLTTFQNQFEYEIILGMSTDGKPITLHKCYATNYHSTNIQYSTANYNALFIFIGKHFSQREDIKFSKIHFHLTCFDEWMQKSGFQATSSPNLFGISYSQPEMIEFQIDDQFSLSIFFGVSSQFESVGEKEQKVKQRIVLTIESVEEVLFFSFQDKLSDIRKFLSLACLTPIFPIEVSSSYPVSENSRPPPNTQIYFQQSDMPEKIKEIHSMDMLFTFKDISDDPQKYFKNWIENKAILEPIYNLYFGIIYNKHTYLDQKFLQLSHALESFHRRTSNETELDNETHEQRIRDILNGTPEQYREWLKIKLSFSNEISLRKRLNYLISQFPSVLKNYEDDRSEFVNFIVDTRNYLTHYSNDATRENIEDHNKLHEICQRMELLVEANLLFKLGFSSEKIPHFINNGKRLKGIEDNIR